MNTHAIVVIQAPRPSRATTTVRVWEDVCLSQLKTLLPCLSPGTDVVLVGDSGKEDWLYTVQKVSP